MATCLTGLISHEELFARDQELWGCIKTDPGRRDENLAVLHHNGDLEGRRFLRTLVFFAHEGPTAYYLGRG